VSLFSDDALAASPHLARSSVLGGFAGSTLLRRALAALAFAASSLIAFGAGAQETTTDASSTSSEVGESDETRSYAVGVDIHRPKRKDPSEYRSAQYLAVELRFGPYEPNIDDDFNGPTKPYKDIFGDDTRYQVGIEVDWQALRIPHFGSLGPGIGYGYTRSTAKAPITSTGEPSAEDTSLWIMPMYAVAVLRVDVLARDFRIPLVPYAKGGLAYALWHSGSEGETDEADGVEGEGSETGYHLAAGLMFQFNVLHEQGALDMDNSTGINAAYAFGEYFVSDINSFGTGMQVGANSWVVGIAFEY
jgi:hypothetical protein